MKNRRVLTIILSVLALLAAAMLFVTYGTVLPGAPFAPVQLDEPTIADSDGEIAVIVDNETRRALILNADNDLTGVVDCGTLDSPFDAITDACVMDGRVYLSGVTFAPDGEGIERERVAVYDKGGNLVQILFGR